MSNLVAGQCAFYHHKSGNGWVLGEIEGEDGKDKKGNALYKCKARPSDQGGTLGVPPEPQGKLVAEDIFPITDEGLLDQVPDDLLMLTLLHDSTLCHALNARYFKDIIYTYIGPIVVAFNPFKYTIPHYQDAMMPKYLEEGYPIEKNLPHSWSVAHNTWFELTSRKENQCILVSGESGAGKTEAVKIVLKYVAAISCNGASAERKTKANEVGHRLMQASPILEGFGNAKTVRNDNSSRFGKFMKVQFDPNGLLVGAFTIKYLLEKSRIVTAGPEERCYHSFYQAALGADKSKWGLDGAASNYRSLNAGGCINIPSVDDAADYAANVEAMATVGIKEDEKDEIWKTVGGILNLLTVDFTADGEGSKCDGKSKDAIMKTAALWQVDGEKLQTELVRTVDIIRGAPIERHHTPSKAKDVLEAMVKAIYDNLFDWLITAVNRTAAVSDSEYSNFIGLLDIFGFEDFKVNSFEQLCINLANETLQGHYNNYIFNKDMDECRAEGVDVTQIQFPDNSPCLKLITDKMGIIGMLDEECSLGKGTDQGFLDKVVTNVGDHPFFEKPRTKKDCFIVKHYAGDVTYQIEGFKDKNADTLKDALKLLIRDSGSSFIKELLPEPVEKTGRKITVGGFFKDQLGELMAIINSTNPHWIRCIKPHPAKKPLNWHGQQTLTQLTSSGIIGTVKVRKAGFPIRMRHGDFLKRFRILKPGPVDDPKAKCDEIVTAMKLERRTIQVGTTRVFMKNEPYDALENAKKNALGSYVEIIQAWSRSMHGKIRVGERDFEENKTQIIESLKVTLGLLVQEQRDREALQAEGYNSLLELILSSVTGSEASARSALLAEEDKIVQGMYSRFETDKGQMDRIAAERRRAMLARFEQEQLTFLADEEEVRAEWTNDEDAQWCAIFDMAAREQGVRDECRDMERKTRGVIEEEEINAYTQFIQDERESFHHWKARQEQRLASEWKILLEDVYAVQAKRKAQSIAQEKFMYDARRREMAERRRLQYLAEQIPRNNTAEERLAMEKHTKAARDTQTKERETEADSQVEKLRVRKELLVGEDDVSQQIIGRRRHETAESERRKQQGADTQSKHDALSSRMYPTTRPALNTHQSPPPPYLFSQPTRSTAQEIMTARSPRHSAAHAIVESPNSPMSPGFGVMSPVAAEFMPESAPLFSPVRTRTAAGMDVMGQVVAPINPQPNPVSPPKLGTWAPILQGGAGGDSAR